MRKHTKSDLLTLANGLLSSDTESIRQCIEFVEFDSEGIWHGRARAMMCRRFKHVELSIADSERLVVAVLNRFKSGQFSEQFRDMLKLALTLDRDSTVSLARILAVDSRDYVRYHAEWILRNHQTETMAEQSVPPKCDRAGG